MKKKTLKVPVRKIWGDILKNYKEQDRILKKVNKVLGEEGYKLEQFAGPGKRDGLHILFIIVEK